MPSGSFVFIILAFFIILSLLYNFLIITIPKFFLTYTRLKIRYCYQLKEERVKVGSVNWSFLRGGKGLPVILLPGFGSHKYQWGNEIYKLTSNYELIIPDLPGGGTTRVSPDAALTPIAQAERVSDFIDKIDIKQPCILIGASVGGLIAGILIKQKPTIARKLILIGPAGFKGERKTEVIENYLHNGQHPFSYTNYNQLKNLYALLFYNPPKIPKLIGNYLARVNKKAIHIRERYAKDMRPFILDGLDGALDKFPNQILIIWGKYDNIFDHTNSIQYSNKSNNIYTHIIEAGHLPYLEKPDKVYNLILRFLNDNNY
ncbi:alpha/beta hydrolase [Vibrio sp.]|uniref:alpha/beta fold hydrolase n=1 Tax=Vibrio sp. TaxID=678 RepID=UPI00311D979D